MNNSTTPLTMVNVGDRIGHDLIPDRVWTGPVLEIDDCEMGGSRAEPHQRYQIIDPEGNEDWICSYDAHRAP